MAKKTEAQLILKIKTMGKEAIDGAGKSFDTLKSKMSNVVDVGKKLALGVAGIVTSMGLLAEKAGKFQQVEDAFKSLAKAQGESADSVLSKMKELTDGMVSELDLMVAANKAALLGLPLDSFPEMLEIAKSASEATGETMQFMLDSIVVGLGRQSKLILDNLGIIIDTEKAYEKYAETLNTTAAALTEAEKKQAFINEAVRIGTENANKMESSGDNASKAWQRFKAAMEDTAVVIGELVAPFMTDLFNTVTDLMGAFKTFTEGNTFLTFLESVAILTEKAKKEFDDWSSALSRVYEFVTGERSFKDTFFINKDDIAKNKTHQENLLKIEKEFAEKRKNLGKDYRDFLERNTEEKNAAIEEQETDHQKELQRIQTEFQAVGPPAPAGLSQEGPQGPPTPENIRALSQETESFLETIGQKADQNIGMIRDGVQDIARTGIEGFVQNSISALTESFLPGFGEVAGQVFELLSQEQDQFAKSMEQLLSVDFIENVAKNIPTLLTMVSEAMPEIVETLTRELLANSPEIVAALVKSFSDPDTFRAMVEGFIEGVVAGGKEIGDAIADAFKKGLTDIGGFLGTDGGGGGGGLVQKAKDVFGFEHGGFVPGVQRLAAGGTVDTVNTRLTPGEFVVNSRAAAANASLLQSINNGQQPMSQGSGGVTIVVNGGLLGDEATAKQFAKAVDEQLLKLRQGNESVAFDTGVF